MSFVASVFGSPDTAVGEFNAIEVDALSFEAASVALSELATYVDNVDLPLRGVKRIAREDMKERFDTETAPDGNKWFALDPHYAERKEAEVGFEHPILTREKDLRNKATEAGAWSISGESVWFSTSGLPEYWRVHQLGSEDFGTVFHASANPTGESNLEGGIQNIPPRPFIGLSAEAEGKILELFDIWFSNGLAEASKSFAVSSVGTLHVRTPRGQFGERIIF